MDRREKISKLMNQVLPKTKFINSKYYKLSCEAEEDYKRVERKLKTRKALETKASNRSKKRRVFTLHQKPSIYTVSMPEELNNLHTLQLNTPPKVIDKLTKKLFSRIRSAPFPLDLKHKRSKTLNSKSRVTDMPDKQLYNTGVLNNIPKTPDNLYKLISDSCENFQKTTKVSRKRIVRNVSNLSKELQKCKNHMDLLQKSNKNVGVYMLREHIARSKKTLT